MPMKLLSADDFRTAAKAGEHPDGTVFRFATGEPQQVGEEDARTQRFVFSDATVDHSNDSIDPKGWDLGVFNRNPVALFAHMSWDPPIGRASNVSVQGGKLSGDIEFASPDVYEFADTIYRLVKGGFLKATSVGFLPKEWVFSSDKDRPYGIDFKKQTLLEISVCPVPCNPNALGEARSAGVDTRPLAEWAEKVLDSGDIVFMPRQELDGLRTQAKGAEPKRFYVQADNHLSAAQAEKVRDAVKRWQQDPAEVLVLDAGVTLRTVGEEPLAPVIEPAVTNLIIEVDEAAIEDLVGKAGRRISAATRAKLQQAMDMSAAHHEAMTNCIKDAMGADDPDEEPDADQDDPDEQPPGTVVLESDEHLSPEERRLKEARALKATLPTND